MGQVVTLGGIHLAEERRGDEGRRKLPLSNLITFNSLLKVSALAVSSAWKLLSGTECLLSPWSELKFYFLRCTSIASGFPTYSIISSYFIFLIALITV